MPKIIRAEQITSQERWLPQIPLPEPAVADTVAEIILQAENEAAAIREAAAGERADILHQAYEEGLAEGKRVGELQYQEKTSDLQKLIERISGEHAEYFTQVEPELVQLATAIAEKVIEQQLTIRPQVIVNLTRAHMKRIRDRASLIIRLHLDDLPLVAAQQDALLQEIDGIDELQLVEDKRVERGGLMIEAASGTFDDRISTKLDIIQRTLVESTEVASEPAEG